MIKSFFDDEWSVLRRDRMVELTPHLRDPLDAILIVIISIIIINTFIAMVLHFCMYSKFPQISSKMWFSRSSPWNVMSSEN